ncbi:hypothetical protein BCIN_07g05980 [Botrytis cinerea B05.10]|uniref:Uncharacterized protein n=1 Tax=Botryotinia fuckeliana (strain B05.10) TaxID=332648 RepID=A0A384JNX4_BOTFB|nr:hypothetical protein BCIN_07g05980 [Botrytis cinerea B05.10]ATZ52087.1 hypothetical protein BCIN_07g05980 [Botrytis cinerea B05.10]
MRQPPTPFPPSEKSHILSLCTQHNIRLDHRTSRYTWPQLIFALEREAPLHYPGGEHFVTDPWPPRIYITRSLRGYVRRWMRAAKIEEARRMRAERGKTLTETIEEHIESGNCVRTDFWGWVMEPGWV